MFSGQKLLNFGHFSSNIFSGSKLLRLHVSRYELPTLDLSLTKILKSAGQTVKFGLHGERVPCTKISGQE